MRDFLLKNAKQFDYTFGIVNVKDCQKYLDDERQNLATLLAPPELDYIERAGALKRKLEFLAGRLAAKHAYSAMFGVDKKSFADINIIKQKNGSPVIEGQSDFIVTISHSHDVAIALLAKRPIGLDVEKIESRPSALLNYFCHPDEKKIYNQFDDSSKIRDELLTTWWTRKEAIAKYTQLGGKMVFRDMNTIEDSFIVGKPPAHIQLVSNVDDGYALTIAI